MREGIWMLHGGWDLNEPVFVNQKSLICSITGCKKLRNGIYSNHQTFLPNIAPVTLFKRKIAANKSCENFTILSQVYFFIWLACKNVSRVHGFLSMKWFTKGETFTSYFNFDLNRSARKKKMCSNMSIFKPCPKSPPPPPPLKMTMNRGRHGEPREKLIPFLLRRRMIFCLHVNRFLTVNLWNIYLTEL